VYKGEALLLLVQGKAQGASYKALGASLCHGLDAHGGGIAHFVHAQFFAQKGDELAGLGGPRGKFHTGVYVFGVFAENDHVDALGVFDGRFKPFKVTHRADAGVEVKALAQGHVEAADARAHGGAEGALHGKFCGAQGLHGFFRQGRAGFFHSLVACQQLCPLQIDAGVFGSKGSFNDRARGLPDFGADAVAFDPVDSLVHGISLP